MGVMGDLRHRQKRFADAFRIYASGNEQYRSTARTRFANGASGLDAVRWMQSYYARQQPRPASSARTADDPSRCHVHLVGFIRSGTTLLEQALASNPDVVTMEEKEALTNSGPIYLKSGETLDLLHALNDEERARFVQSYWKNVRGLGYNPDGKVFHRQAAVQHAQAAAHRRAVPVGEDHLRHPRSARRHSELHAPALQYERADL